MKHCTLTLAPAIGAVTAAPAPPHAQCINQVNSQRLAQRQVINWFQAYLGRLPNANELAVLTNQYMLSRNALYVQSVILASNEFFVRSGGTLPGFLNRLF